MSIKTALQIIKDYQIWRRGGQNPMPNPTYIGQAFDVLIAYVEGMEKAEDFEGLVHAHPAVSTSVHGTWARKSECPKWVINHLTQDEL